MSRIDIRTAEKRFPVTPDLYGLFFEDISHAGDGGLYPEMLRNRSFEDSLLPEGCVSHDGGKTFVSPTGWIDEFNNGEGMTQWVKDNGIAPTPVPAWYCDRAEMRLETGDVLNAKRKASLFIDFEAGGSIRNAGYAGVPQEKGKKYVFYMFAKAENAVRLRLTAEENGIVSASAGITVLPGGWTRYDAELTANLTAGNAVFRITCPEGGKLLLGFTSLMPADTFMGHGLRKDLAEKLRDMNPAFMRFPGGCIVEGFTMDTVWYFRNTIGPVWERPSHWLLWHYRTTNGLGFHEYLQLCEDLNVAPLYVCNCGMTCQGRGPRYFDEREQADMLEDILGALEYALGPADSGWGAVRAKNGHEAPFRLDYLEIGNENSGPEYEWRYDMVRNAVLARWPHLKIIADDRGRARKLETDIADDHFYNMPEFFAENITLYDRYDRKDADVFVGEFSVNQTYEGQLRAAVAEAMFMLGFERNQDKVRLASYAPLFQHAHYGSWFPNLIIYDNYRSFAIPTYYCWRLFGGSRGKYVVASDEQIRKLRYDIHGWPALSGDDGVRYRHPVWNGRQVTPTRNILAGCENGDDGVITVRRAMEPGMPDFPFRVYPLVMLEEGDACREGTFETDVFCEAGKDIALGVLVSPKPLSYYDRTNPNPCDPWSMRFLEVNRWLISGGRSCLVRGSFPASPISDEVDVQLRENEWNHLKYTVADHTVRMEVNGTEIGSAQLPVYPAMGFAATDTDDRVIVKIVNFDDVPEPVEITLDRDVEPDYEVQRMTGGAEDENSLDRPEYVHDEVIALTGASRGFTYVAPALSVNVLLLNKKQ
ncbi:MAG: alpha-L-arabinofuranosidase C-terminal domain-containing protein [Clostridia bacterium]|nr:alpha-L-arabinofuranosidase C-terminal domain-containing protein [Clostridia bacterium]